MPSDPPHRTMHRTLTTLALAALFAILTACSPDTPRNGASTDTDGGDPAHDHEHSHGHGDAAVELTLDDGRKWQMDDHTRAVTGRMVAAVHDADAESLDERRALGRELQGMLDELISGCRMTGPAHDQLHVFLTAYMPVVKELSDETDDARSAEHLQRVHTLLQAYQQHFE